MKVAQLCPTLCDSMGCSLPGSSLHGILQAIILEWVAMPFSRGSSQPRNWTQVSCLAGRFFTVWDLAMGTFGHSILCVGPTWAASLASTPQIAVALPSSQLWQPPLSPDTMKCLLWGKLTLVENHGVCSRGHGHWVTRPAGSGDLCA